MKPKVGGAVGPGEAGAGAGAPRAVGLEPVEAVEAILLGAAPRRIWVGAIAGEGDGVRAEALAEAVGKGWQG